jgi:hypothetical protein
MQEGEEPHLDANAADYREALMAFIAKRKRVGREQVLDAVFRMYDTAIAELIASGRIVVETSPQNESHLDVFVAAGSEDDPDAGMSGTG